MIPSSYLSAMPRCVLPQSPNGDLAFALDTENGPVRMRVSERDALWLMSGLIEAMRQSRNQTGCSRLIRWLERITPTILNQPNVQSLRATSMPLHCSDTSQHDAPSDEWRITISGDVYLFSRCVNGYAIETYRPVGRGEAAVWAVAIIQGYEPPRHLQQSDAPLD